MTEGLLLRNEVENKSRNMRASTELPNQPAFASLTGLRRLLWEHEQARQSDQGIDPFEPLDRVGLCLADQGVVTGSPL